VKPKTILTQPNRPLFDAVLSGRADVGFTMIAEILAEPSVAYAGSLPAELQGDTKSVGGMVASGKQTAASRGLLEFLASPDAIAALKAKGFEPF
jgi:molybdate transport system substrate-binding protein